VAPGNVAVLLDAWFWRVVEDAISDECQNFPAFVERLPVFIDRVYQYTQITLGAWLFAASAIRGATRGSWYTLLPEIYLAQGVHVGPLTASAMTPPPD
jgi:hypothetical protein